MSIKRLGMLVLVLAITIGLGNRVAFASSLCVQPSGAGRCFTSIQAAVDAANSGDQIIIRAGKYIEQVTVSGKDLSLIGRSGAIIQAPSEMADVQAPIPGFQARPILLITEAEVTVRDLIIDGANSAEKNPFLQGITFINAGGIIQDNLVKNIGFGEPRLPLDENGNPLYQGYGILVVNVGATPRSVTIKKNQVINYNNIGILIDSETDPSNPSPADLSIQMIDNTVVGQGPNAIIDQWGIFIGSFGFADPQSSITGVVRDNRIQDLTTVSPFPLPGVGIVAINPFNLEISDNNIENVNVGIAANQAFGSQITDNLFSGPAQDVTGSTGILLSGTDSLVANNKFKKLELGVLLMVEDPEFGSAFNTSITENKFDKVALEILTGAGSPAVSAMRAEPAHRWIRPFRP